MNILHMNSAVINGCMLLQALRPRVAVIVGNPLICCPREDIWASWKHESALLFFHTAVVHSEYRRWAAVLKEMMSLLRNHKVKSCQWTVKCHCCIIKTLSDVIVT